MLGSSRDLAEPEDGRLAPLNNHLVGAGLPGYFMGQTSLVAQTVKASAYNAEDLSSIPGLGRSPGEGNGTPLQSSCLENPMDGGAW